MIASGTPLTTPVNPFRSVPFTYVAGSVPWQQFDVSGVNTGGQTASFFDPAIAYGRLDSLSTSAGVLGPAIPLIAPRVIQSLSAAAVHPKEPFPALVIVTVLA